MFDNLLILVKLWLIKRTAIKIIFGNHRRTARYPFLSKW